MVMFNTSVTCCEHIRIANLPLLYPPTQTSLCVKEKIIKLRVSLNLTGPSDLTRIYRFTHLQLQTSKIGHKLQSYPVNLALKVSSMTLLLISNRIILNNENCSEFHKASSLKTLKLFDGIQDGRRELLLVTWCWFSFRVPQRLPRFFNFPLFFSLIPRDSYI